jgi:endonuclease/exonuclease/phosphatase family metal-dependent hydrolase
MRKNSLLVIAFGIFFLFVIQSFGILVESIYILDLMNTSLDEKALGVLFFFSPLLLFLFRKRIPTWLVWAIFGVLLISRGLIPYLDTLARMLASGIGTGSALLLFPFLATARPKGESQTQSGIAGSAGLALAVGVSVLLRTLNYSLDLSVTPAGGWIGWGLGLLLGRCLTQLDWDDQPALQRSKPKVGSVILGIYLVLALTYFAFSAPAVIARWTQGNYVLIVLAVSLLSVGWVFLTLSNPGLFERISHRVLLLWNLVFTLSLTWTILAQRIAFPLSPDSPAVVVSAPSLLQQIPLFLMLLSFPVIFLDLYLFFSALHAENPSPRQFASGMLLGSLVLVLLIFINIFTNVWGYVAPVSTIFRNQFYLPYLLITSILALLMWLYEPVRKPIQSSGAPISWGWSIFLAALFLGTVLFAWRTVRTKSGGVDQNSLVVMTYNIQQANDDFGERSYDRQLALIRQVSPDILALQESDSARISLNNNDYVRYYAAKLGYYSYYGPTTVSGTFGTAILSKYPLQNQRTVFTFSDVDEIGTAEAEIKVGDRTFTIYNVHPDGSDTAMLVFARRLLERSNEKKNVIVLGDYNLRDNEEAFQLIANVYTNAWTSVYPSKISADGTDMSGRNRIDHIFFSSDLSAQNPIYVLPPDSATDHPVHWTEIFWEK